MSTASDIAQVEQSIAGAKDDLKRQECLARLEQNKDFRDLIMHGFLEDHAIRQVMLKAHPGLQGEKDQAMLDHQIRAIGGFKQYMVAINTAGTNAAITLAADEDTLIELRNEEIADA